MELTIPSKLYLLNAVWKVKVKPKIIHKSKKVNGLCDIRKKTIILSEESINIQRTFFHEVSHLLNMEYGWINTESVTIAQGDFWEALYSQISPSLLITDQTSDTELLGLIETIKNEVIRRNDK